MNRLLFVLSTISEKSKSNTFYFPENIMGTESSINECVGQLEPTAKYMINSFPGKKLQMIILCSKQTVVDIKEIDNKKYTAVTYFVARILDFIGAKYDSEELLEKFSNDLLFQEKEYLYDNISFKFIAFDEEKPISGISTVVDYIRAETTGVEEFWIDTHGGFRDAALILNGVVSLLEVYNIIPNQILGVRFGDNNRIVDQSNAFNFFKFVSGMTEFIKFGSADTLLDYFSANDNSEVRKLINAMKTISDGTRLCDPGLYIKGLDALRESLNNKNHNDALLHIFEDYIRKDYGNLLDENRTTLDIVKRCYEKKLYQQALTFIESLMPDLFFEKKILFCLKADEKIINEIKGDAEKDYISSEHFVFDQFLFSLTGYYTNQKADYANIANNQVGIKDFYSVQVLNNKFDSVLDTGFIDGTGTITVTKSKDKKIGEIEIFTNVKAEYRSKVAVLLRLHKAIKNCRNLTNHAKDGFRPTLADIENGIKHYIELTTEILAEDCIEDKEYVSSGKTKCFSTKKDKGKSKEKAKEQLKDYLNILEIGGNKNLLRGQLTSGEKGVIPQKYSENIDKNSYINKTVEVYIGNKTGEYYLCEPVEPLK